MTTPPPEANAGAAPADPAHAAAPPHSSHRRAWSLLGGGVLLLVMAYVLMLRAYEGDYLINRNTGHAVLLRMRGIPRWTQTYYFGTQDFRYYYVRPGGATIGEFADTHTGSGGVLDREWEGTGMAPIPGERHLYEFAPGPRDYLFRGSAEKFPAETLSRISDALKEFPTGNPAELLDAAREVHARCPDRLTTQYWLVAALCHAGELDEAQRRVEEFRPAFEADDSASASLLFYQMKNDLLTSTPEMTARWARYSAILPRRALPTIGLPAMLDAIARFRPEDLPREHSLDRSSPSSLSIRTMVRVAAIWAEFLMADGRRDEAHHLLLGAWSLASVSANPTHANAGPVTASAQDVLLAAAYSVYGEVEWTAESLERVWADWEAVWGALPAYDSEEAARQWRRELRSFGEFADLAARDEVLDGFNVRSAFTRHVVMEAYRQAFREMLRAVHHRQRHGAWPETDENDVLVGMSLGNDNPPMDPFADPPHRPRAYDVGVGLMIVSVGPDGIEEDGFVAYDASKGIGSGGDILFGLRNVRSHRCPTEPGHGYEGHEEFESRYPRGLMRDFFADSVKSPLNLTTDGSGLIWSYGPDEDEATHSARVLPGQQVDVLYDPTNGITSRGDLYMRLNFRVAP